MQGQGCWKQPVSDNRKLGFRNRDAETLIQLGLFPQDPESWALSKWFCFGGIRDCGLTVSQFSLSLNLTNTQTHTFIPQCLALTWDRVLVYLNFYPFLSSQRCGTPLLQALDCPMWLFGNSLLLSPKPCKAMEVHWIEQDFFPWAWDNKCIAPKGHMSTKMLSWSGLGFPVHWCFGVEWFGLGCFEKILKFCLEPSKLFYSGLGRRKSDRTSLLSPSPLQEHRAEWR